ncbi:MAG: NAD(P)H-dependent glycerol-3-phosphate dehydrogenase [Puniceicoccales bacterium]|nr:NAD(P)H-dependent glycerol-3-phosphate dehydrogenase [Puniceicoccales bacterium]
MVVQNALAEFLRRRSYAVVAGENSSGEKMKKFVIFGAGAWGTALALHLGTLGYEVLLVLRREEQALEMARTRENSAHFPGFQLPANIHVSANLTLKDAAAVFLGCATAGVIEFCKRINTAATQDNSYPPIISLCKGLVPETRQLPSDAIAQLLPRHHVGALSGPTYARDVAQGKQTAAVLAFAKNFEKLCEMQALISSHLFRVYRTNDLRGVELGGALKNPYAIGMGIAEQFAGSDNGRAALLTRMLAELTRIGTALGGCEKTFYGLSGLGDLVATGSGEWSRNRSFGLRIGRGEKAEVIAREGITIEGYGAAKGFREICHAKNIRAPILEGLCGILYESRPPEDICNMLMCGDLREEIDHYTNA